MYGYIHGVPEKTGSVAKTIDMEDYPHVPGAATVDHCIKLAIQDHESLSRVRTSVTTVGALT